MRGSIAPLFSALLSACSCSASSPGAGKFAAPPPPGAAVAPAQVDAASPEPEALLSVADLVAHPPTGGTFAFAGYLASTDVCPPCPAGVVCKPCIGAHIIVAAEASDVLAPVVALPGMPGIAGQTRAVMVFTGGHAMPDLAIGTNVRIDAHAGPRGFELDAIVATGEDGAGAPSTPASKACTPGAKRCWNAWAQLCIGQGVWTNAINCSKSSPCSNGVCTRWTPPSDDGY
jgi:hypothetical protein